MSDQDGKKEVLADGFGGSDVLEAPRVEPRAPRTKSFNLDLNIRSPLSLGYIEVQGIDTAPALVRLARTKGLDMIAVTDSYSGAFIDRLKAAASGCSLTILPGVELRCTVGGCRDVQIAALFPEHFMSEDIRQLLQELEIPAAAAGKQEYIMAQPFERILEQIELRGGVVLPSRMDKTPYRMGIIPELVDRFGFRAFDLAYGDSARFFKTRWPKVKFNLFSFSNANALAQVGSRQVKLKLDGANFEALKPLLTRAR